MFVVCFVVSGELVVSERVWASVGDAVQAWRDMGKPGASELAYIAERLFDNYLERVTAPLGGVD